MLKAIAEKWNSAPRWKRVAAVMCPIAIAGEIAYTAIVTGEPAQILGGAALYIGFFIALPLLGLTALAGINSLLERTGVSAILSRHQAGISATINLLFWAGGILAVWTLERPFITTDLRTTYYALVNQVPADRITFEKKPWDCDFDNPPMGNKHCHYVAKAYIASAKDSPDGKKSLYVAYERVQE